MHACIAQPRKILKTPKIVLQQLHAMFENEGLYMYICWQTLSIMHTHDIVNFFSDIEVSCYGYEGIDAVKASLKAGLAQSTEEMPIKINLIAPPQYVMTTTTLDRTEGIAKLNTAIQVIRENIEESEGQFNIKMEVST